MASTEYNREWKARAEHPFRTPRTKLALKLYVSGAVRTQKEAGDIYGLSQTAVSLARRSVSGQALESDFEAKVTERAVSLSAVIAKLSEKALKVMDDQITSGSSEEVKFKAAKDILDRNPETSKTNKIQMESFTLTGRDAKEIAAALAEGRRLHELDAEVATGDFVRVQEVPQLPSITGEAG